MLDINYIRENKELVKENVRKRKSQVDIDQVIELDSKRKELLQRIDEKRAERNASSKEKPDQSQLERLQALKQELEELEPQLKLIEQELLSKLNIIPNMSAHD